MPIPLSGPARKLAWVTDDSRLLVQDWLAGDTLALVTLPGIPAGQLAAADLGGGHGVGLFVGTRNGWIAGYDTDGRGAARIPEAARRGRAGGRPGARRPRRRRRARDRVRLRQRHPARLARRRHGGDGLRRGDRRLGHHRAGGALGPGRPARRRDRGGHGGGRRLRVPRRRHAAVGGAGRGGAAGRPRRWWRTAAASRWCWWPRARRCARWAPTAALRASWTLPGTVAADPALADLDGDGVRRGGPAGEHAERDRGARLRRAWPRRGWAGRSSLASAPQGAPVARAPARRRPAGRA